MRKWIDNLLTIQSKQYFNPLEDEPTRRLVNDWFKENLAHGKQ